MSRMIGLPHTYCRYHGNDSSPARLAMHCVIKSRVPVPPGIFEKTQNVILKLPGLEIYLNLVKDTGIICKTVEKVLVECCSILAEICLQCAFSDKIYSKECCEWSTRFQCKGQENVKNAQEKTWKMP